MAHKGYRNLSESELNDNAIIYSVKEKAIGGIAKEWLRRGLNVKRRSDVVYFITKNGMQISFHFRTPKDEIPVDKIEWDGVKDAWSYTNIEDYNKAKKAYKAALDNYNREKIEDKETILKYKNKIKETLFDVLKNKRTREKYKLPIKFEDLVDLVKRGEDEYNSTVVENDFLLECVGHFINKPTYSQIVNDISYRVCEKWVMIIILVYQNQSGEN